MGVISARSLVAPFIDKKNLITIILIGVFFVVYRLSGGSIERSSTQSRAIPQVAPAGKSFFESFIEDDKVSPAKDLQQLRPEKDTNNTRDNFLADIMQNEKNEATSKGTSPSQLDEIERSLGLR